MPVLLDLARAPTLEALLSAANTQGMDWRISVPAGANPLRVRGIGTLASASGQEISFLANPKYQSQLAATQAGAVIVSADVAEALEAAGADRPRFALVVCKHPYLLYARVAQWFDAARRPALPAATHPRRWSRLTRTSKTTCVSVRIALSSRERGSAAAACWAQAA